MAKPKLTRITLGKVTLVENFARTTDKIVIVHQDGEAGQFDRAKLAKVVEKFFNKHF